MRWSAYTDRGPLGVCSMASNRSESTPTYPRLHVEMRRLSSAALIVDGYLIESAHGVLRSVLNYCGSMDEARKRISECASKYHAQCDDEDIVIR